MRSMSATSVTASVTSAVSSGRIASSRKIGLAASVRTTYRSARRLSSSAHWRSSTNSASGRSSASERSASAARSNCRSSFWSAGMLSRLGSVAAREGPQRPAEHLLGVGPGGPSSRGRSRQDRTHQQERPAELLVGGDRHGVNPALRRRAASPASSSRVFPIPGSPSRLTADRPSAAAVASSASIAPSSTERPDRPPSPSRAAAGTRAGRGPAGRGPRRGPTTRSSTGTGAHRGHAMSMARGAREGGVHRVTAPVVCHGERGRFVSGDRMGVQTTEEWRVAALFEELRPLMFAIAYRARTGATVRGRTGGKGTETRPPAPGASS